MAVPPNWGFADLTAEARWVLGRGLPTTLNPPARPLTPTGWAGLRSAATQHGLEGLLVGAVASGELPVTDAQRAEVAELELDLARNRIGYEQVVAPVLAMLDDAGIEVRLLKGVAVARLEYPDELWRTTNDLDLLVRPSQIDEAVQLLVDAGGSWYDPEPTPGWNRVVGKGATVRLPAPGPEVDLHRLLVWGPFGVRLPPEELWRRSRRFRSGSLELATLGREETLLHACAHLLVLGVVRAREVRDVAQILHNPDLDADLVLALARRWGQEALVATAIVMAERELRLQPDAHPLHTWAHAHRVTWRDRLWLRTESPVDRPHGLEQLAVFLELGRRAAPAPGSVPGRAGGATPATARRILWRANFRPTEGTYASPSTRLRSLAKRVLPAGRVRILTRKVGRLRTR